jgi:hypothetical protein
MTGTFEKIKDKVTGKDSSGKDYNESGGKEPMNPEDIGENAIDRGQNTEIASEGQTGTDSPEAQEKYRKKGMMDANE